MSEEWNQSPGRYGSPNDPEEQISLLEAFDRAVASLSSDNFARERLLALRAEIAAQEEMVGDAREMIEKLEQVIKKVTSPANRIGTFLGSPARDTAQIVVGGADYYCNVDPRISLGKLQKGTRVLVNEAYVIVGDLGFETAGPVTKVAEVLDSDRLRVGAEHGTQSLVLQRSAQLAKASLKAGDDVRVDANYRVALELLASPQSHDHYLDEVPELPWEKVGGQEEALQAIRDAIELPLLHEELFQKFQHATPKGFLLYGPPGCGKTLIGKATAYNLTKQLRNKSGTDMREYFMHIKGPEILNMWVGESERMVREIFATAREKRREGYMPFLFIDEAESHPRHPPRFALFEHPFNARSDVLHGDGWDRFAQRSGHHPRFESRGFDRPGDPAPGPDRSENQGQAAEQGRRPRDLPHLSNGRSALRRRASRWARNRKRRRSMRSSAGCSRCNFRSGTKTGFSK